MFVFGLRPSTIDSMSEGSLSQAWAMPALAPTAQNRHGANTRRWLVPQAPQPTPPASALTTNRLSHARQHPARILIVPRHQLSAVDQDALAVRLVAPRRRRSDKKTRTNLTPKCGNQDSVAFCAAVALRVAAVGCNRLLRAYSAFKAR